MSEDVGRRKLLELAVDGLVSIWRDRRDIDQTDNTVIRPRGRDDGAAVGVADKDRGAADPTQRVFDCVNVGSMSIKAVLGGHYFVSLRLKRGNNFAKARAVWPNP